MGLYESIRMVCTENGISVNKLEKELGFARSSISKFNTSSPSYDKLKKMADYLGVTIDYLTSRDNDSLTVAAHRKINGSDLTDAEIEEVENYIQFVKQRRLNNKR